MKKNKRPLIINVVPLNEDERISHAEMVSAYATKALQHIYVIKLSHNQYIIRVQIEELIDNTLYTNQKTLVTARHPELPATRTMVGRTIGTMVKDYAGVPITVLS